MKLLATKSTTNICKRIASNVDKIPFQRKFQELLLLQGEVPHQKLHPLFPGHFMLFSQVDVKAPQHLPGLVYTHNPRFHDNMFITELAHPLNSSLHCIKTRRGILYQLSANSYFSHKYK